MVDTIKLNRAEHKILKCLYNNGCTSQYNSMTITELLDMDNELSTKTVIYKNLKKLISEKCVQTGIIDGHANTYYLLERAIKIIEGKEPDKITQQTENSTSISYDSNSVRNKLLEIMERGLMLKSIAVNAGLSESELSRFKNGVDSLKESDARLLAEYLNATIIPVWNNSKEPKKQMSLRERLLASKNKQNEEKQKRKRSNVSIDLLNELES